MDSVRIEKTKLLDIVRQNRDEHAAEADQAKADYRAALVIRLEDMLARARAGEEVRHSIDLPSPSDHRKEYDRAIRMLELSADSVVELGQHEFSQYVLNEWQWMPAFKAATTLYASSLRG